MAGPTAFPQLCSSDRRRSGHQPPPCGGPDAGPRSSWLGGSSAPVHGHGPRRRLGRVRTAAALAAFTLGTALGACGGEGSGGSAPSAKPGGPRSPASPEGAKPEGPEAAGGRLTVADLMARAKGIVYVRCAGDDEPDKRGLVFSVVDAGDGRQVASAVAGVHDLSCGPQLVRSRFDDRFARVTDQRDGHIGFVDVRTGAFTDVTARRPRGDFDPAPRETNPVFRPGTDEIWYIDLADPQRPRLKSTTAGGGPVVDRGELRAPQAFYFLPGLEAVVLAPTPSDSLVVSPNRGRAIAAATECPGASGLTLNCTGLYVLDVPPTGVVSLTLDQVRQGRLRIIEFEPECAPNEWLDDRSFVCVSPGPVLRVGTFDANFTTVSFRDLLNNGPRDIAAPVVSPDRREVVFFSDAGATESEPGLFKVGLDGGSPPRRISTGQLTIVQEAPGTFKSIGDVAVLEWR